MSQYFSAKIYTQNI